MNGEKVLSLMMIENISIITTILMTRHHAMNSILDVVILCRALKGGLVKLLELLHLLRSTITSILDKSRGVCKI